MSESNPWRPRRFEDIDQWQIETDVAIVGFGGAGACAAIEAADAGAEVAIFEVASTTRPAPESLEQIRATHAELRGLSGGERLDAPSLGPQRELT